MMFRFSWILPLLLPRALAHTEQGYEVWASDQSNSVAGQDKLGVKGSFLWIWDSDQIAQQLEGKGDATSVPCTPGATAGPCDIMNVFPQTLVERNADGTATGQTLGSLPNFGRLHGVLKDPMNRYVVANMFVKDGGYVGIIDTETKEAVSLFRVTEYTFGVTPSTSRSVHMSFWMEDGSAIIVANLHGKAIERINISRDSSNKITNASFDRSGGLGLGSSQTVASPATYFTGPNAFGRDLVGDIVGDYATSDLGDLTPNSKCKENGCATGSDGASGGRGNNLPICPIPSSNGLIYTTLAGGGLLIVDAKKTPMQIKGEYGNNVVYGAGCGGVETNGKMYTNAGVSASGAGATQSMFAVWQFDDTNYLDATSNAENTPVPALVYEDSATNTMTGGNTNGPASDGSGQLPGMTTRRDSHGAAATANYVQVVDRIQNLIEVFHTSTFERSTIDMTTKSGVVGETSESGGCLARSITDGGDFPLNDPAPDLMEVTPDGKYLMIALRGPTPVSVPHAAQGSCPGVGIVKLTEDGKKGALVDVLRAVNTVADTIDTFTAPGGAMYGGNERSDVHGAIVVTKEKSKNEPCGFFCQIWTFFTDIFDAVWGFFGGVIDVFPF